MTSSNDPVNAAGTTAVDMSQVTAYEEKLLENDEVCPVCGSDNIGWGEHEFSSTAWHEATCYNCGSKWEDLYDFVGVVIMKIRDTDVPSHSYTEKDDR